MHRRYLYLRHSNPATSIAMQGLKDSRPSSTRGPRRLSVCQFYLTSNLRLSRTYPHRPSGLSRSFRRLLTRANAAISKFNGTRENWPTWKVKVLKKLQDKKRDLILSAKCTTEVNAEDSAFLASLLFDSMTDKALRPFLSRRAEFLQKGVDMWGVLMSKFEPKTVTSATSRMTELSSIRMSRNESIDDFVSRIRTLQSLLGRSRSCHSRAASGNLRYERSRPRSLQRDHPHVHPRKDCAVNFG